MLQASNKPILLFHSAIWKDWKGSLSVFLSAHTLLVHSVHMTCLRGYIAVAIAIFAKNKK